MLKWGFWNGFVWEGCEGIFMVYIWVESSVFALFDGGLIFKKRLGVREFLKLKLSHLKEKILRFVYRN